MGLFDGAFKAFRKTTPAAPAQKPGRNEECWCGSGKKYKKCHLPEDEKGAAGKAACSLACGQA
jgi:SEC-C motif-containing protein